MNIYVSQMTEQLAKEVIPLLEQNHAESGQIMNQDFNPDMQELIDLDENLVVFVGVENEQMVAIAVFLISQHTHYKHLSVADQLTFYIEPKYRGSTVTFLKATEKFFTEMHIDIIQQGAIIGSNFCKLLELKGYTAKDVCYVKELGFHE